jgi:hypothetical protein
MVYGFRIYLETMTMTMPVKFRVNQDGVKYSLHIPQEEIENQGKQGRARTAIIRMLTLMLIQNL